MAANPDILLEQAAEALKNKQYPNAEALQRKGCELLRELGGEESRLADEVEKLAQIHYVQKKFSTSASEYQEVVRMREKALPENDLGILKALYGLAKAHFEGQQYELSETEMRKALAIAEIRSDSRETLAFCLYELGWLLYYVGKHREAEPYLLKSLPICEKTYGRSHSQTIRALVGIALLYTNCAEIGKDPEPYFRKVIEASKSDQSLHEYYLENLYRLASFLEESKRFDESDELFLQLLAHIRGKSSQDDSDDWWIINGCVKYFKKRGKETLVADLIKSNPGHDVYTNMVKERLDHAEQTLSENDPEFAEALLAAGNNATFDGKYQEAEPLLMRALDACLRIHGEKNSQTIFALNRVCIIKRLLGKFDEAEYVIGKAVEGAKEGFSDQTFYAWTLENLALLREAEGNADDAVRAYAQAVTEYERICGFPSYETVEALYHQCGSLLRMSRLGPAEAAIRRTISVMDQISGLSDYEKSDYLSTLASILEASGRSTEGTEMRNRAEQLFEQAKQQNERED